MTEVQVTPETLTFQHIQKWTGTEMRNQMAHPDMRAAIINLLKNRNPEEIRELAAKEAQVVVVDSAPVAPDPAAEEAARVAAEAARIAAEEAAKPKVFAVDYQVRDEKGNAIGRPTHLEAPTEEGLRLKLIEAHTQATRAFHRLKEQKTTFKQPQVQTPIQQPERLTDDELKQALNDVRSEDPKISAQAQAKITLEERRKAAEAQRLYLEEQASYAFLRKHIHDFNNCEANIKMIDEYIKEHKLEWTLDNLELAFIARESELAPKVVEPVAPVVLNPAPTVTPVVTPAAPVVVQPVVPAPVAPAVPNPAPAVPRPGVNGGVVPGESSGVRPAAKPAGLTAEEIRSWDAATYKKHLANPAMRAQIEAFIAARNAQKGK